MYEATGSNPSTAETGSVVSIFLSPSTCGGKKSEVQSHP